MYNGYTWTPACYLYPIVFSDFMLSSPDGDVNNSPIYQNPGWPIEMVLQHWNYRIKDKEKPNIFQ